MHFHDGVNDKDFRVSTEIRDDESIDDLSWKNLPPRAPFVLKLIVIDEVSDNEDVPLIKLPKIVMKGL